LNIIKPSITETYNGNDKEDVFSFHIKIR
jgi:hypothetical protein